MIRLFLSEKKRNKLDFQGIMQWERKEKKKITQNVFSLQCHGFVVSPQVHIQKNVETPWSLVRNRHPRLPVRPRFQIEPKECLLISHFVCLSLCLLLAAAMKVLRNCRGDVNHGALPHTCCIKLLRFCFLNYSAAEWLFSDGRTTVVQNKYSYFLPLCAIFKVQWVKFGPRMTQQLVTIHGCKYTDASVVSYQHMQSAGRGSTALGLGDFKDEALHGGREWKRIQMHAAHLYRQLCRAGSPALFWSSPFWWGLHPSASKPPSTTAPTVPVPCWCLATDPGEAWPGLGKSKRPAGGGQPTLTKQSAGRIYPWSERRNILETFLRRDEDEKDL